jgi:hypothetical protein
MDVKNLKGHYRRATSLVDLGMEARAHEACEAALLLCSTPDDKQPFLQLLQRIMSIKAVSSNKNQAHGDGRDQESVFLAGEKEVKESESAGKPCMSERELHASLHEGTASLEQMRMFNNIMSLMPKQAKALLPGLDERIPAFHVEYAKEGMWPTGCDKQACGRLLEMAYQLARCVCVCVYIYIYVCVCMYMYMFIYIYNVTHGM